MMAVGDPLHLLDDLADCSPPFVTAAHRCMRGSGFWEVFDERFDSLAGRGNSRNDRHAQNFLQSFQINLDSSMLGVIPHVQRNNQACLSLQQLQGEV